jgi:hypothetical protein
LLASWVDCRGSYRQNGGRFNQGGWRMITKIICKKCLYPKDVVFGQQCVSGYRHIWAWWNVNEWVIEWKRTFVHVFLIFLCVQTVNAVCVRRRKNERNCLCSLWPIKEISSISLHPLLGVGRMKWKRCVLAEVGLKPVPPYSVPFQIWHPDDGRCSFCRPEHSILNWTKEKMEWVKNTFQC